MNEPVGLSTYYSEGAWGWKYVFNSGAYDHSWGYGTEQAALSAARQAGYEESAWVAA
jgi:hypothetical protein